MAYWLSAPAVALQLAAVVDVRSRSFFVKEQC